VGVDKPASADASVKGALSALAFAHTSSNGVAARPGRKA